MKKEKIRTLEDMGNAIFNVLKNPQYASIEDFDRFDISLEPISIHVKDEGHPSAMSATILGCFAKYQDLIYKTVKVAKYGDISKRLSDEDKAGFDLYISFGHGSIFSDIDLQPILESAINKMNGWHVFGAFAFAVSIFTIYKCFKVHSDNKRISKKDFLDAKARMLESSERKEIAIAQARAIEDIGRIAEEMTAVTSSALERLAMVNGDVAINGKSYSRGELAGMARENLRDFYDIATQDDDNGIRQKIVDGEFLVSRIDLKVDGNVRLINKRCINLLDIASGETFKDIEISGKNMTDEQRDVILKAIDGKPLRMRMSIAYGGQDAVKSILILECNGISFE